MAPISGWDCIYTYDALDEGWIPGNNAGLFTCELCGCKKVRYVHVMHNNDFYENLYVGCICAGVMEGDVLQACEREQLIRNRARRKQSYLKRQWRVNSRGNQTLRYKGKDIVVFKLGAGLGVMYGSEKALRYRGKSIENFLTAVHAAFDLVDPLPSPPKRKLTLAQLEYRIFNG